MRIKEEWSLVHLIEKGLKQGSAVIAHHERRDPSSSLALCSGHSVTPDAGAAARSLSKTIAKNTVNRQPSHPTRVCPKSARNSSLFAARILRPHFSSFSSLYEPHVLLFVLTTPYYRWIYRLHRVSSLFRTVKVNSSHCLVFLRCSGQLGSKSGPSIYHFPSRINFLQ